MHSSFNNISIIYQSYVDHTFQQGLPDRLKQKISTTFREFAVMIKVANNTHFPLVGFTDSTKQVLDPFDTNYQAIDFIDRIEDDGEGHVMLFKGEDFLSLEIDDDLGCNERESEGLKEKCKHLDIPQYWTTSYPLPFDWGCESLGDGFDFCKDLENNCELRRVGGDVCNLIQTTNNSICRASMKITNMTGYFRDAVPFLAPFQFPIVSFSAKSFELQNNVGVIFPCLARV